MPARLNYPGDVPGKASASISDEAAVLENDAIRCEWQVGPGQIKALSVLNKHSDQVAAFEKGFVPRLTLDGGTVLNLESLHSENPVQVKGTALEAVFTDPASGLELRWSAELKDDANAIIQTLSIVAEADVNITELVFIDASLEGARQVGEVAGSIVVCGDIFMGVENPLASNIVDDDGRTRCVLSLNSHLKAGESMTYSCGIGVVPPAQLRRGFLYYIEQRRIHPYRQFLHYNNWYDVFLGRETERMTEQEALDAIEYFGRELVEKRGVKMDAVVWDDGWDDFNTLWDFHPGFPDGFRNLNDAGSKYGIAQGVWMSPNGGYSRAKDARIAYGKPLGYETNDNGYAMGGPNYQKAFSDVCLRMIRDNGVVFFKFDGMGEGGSGSAEQHTLGASGELFDDIHAILELARDLHGEKSDVYVSATAGTWASPYWLLYVDNIWRQGGDSGHHGVGDTRQQWLTYRDTFCCNCVVNAGPLYPLNSLMLHGILIGDRPGRAPSGMAFDEKSVADEAWSFFGSGTCLQELYVSPDVPTDTMLDSLAEAANWARANEDVLIDTHWVGGNPGEGEVYGWASWRPGKGILVLRNPSEAEQSFSFTLKDVLELPAGEDAPMTLQAVYPKGRELPGGEVDAGERVTLTLLPFETVVIESI